MTKDALEIAVAKLAASVRKSTLLVLHHDEKLRKLLAVWPFVPVRARPGRKRRPPGEDAPTGELVAWVWHHFDVDLGEIRAMLGGTFPARRVVLRAQKLRLINPDGTCHEQAEHYLRAATADALEEMASVRKAREAQAKAAQANPAATGKGGGVDAS